MTKIRLSSFSRDASVIAPSVSGSSVSPSPRNAHTLASVARLQSAIFEIAIEARLINRHDRTEAHRDGGEFPEIRHQPGMRIGGEPAAGFQFAAKIFELLYGETAFEKGAGINAGRSVSLEIYGVAFELWSVRARKK